MFVKQVTVGSVDRSNTEEAMEKQVAYLNKCLNLLPKGRIISSMVSTAVLKVGGCRRHRPTNHFSDRLDEEAILD